MRDNKVRVACVQPSSGQDMVENLRIACELIRAAEGKGARLIALPENVALMDHRTEAVHAQAAVLEEHPAIMAFADIGEFIDLMADEAAAAAQTVRSCCVLWPFGGSTCLI
mgnify:CR=1 FL=1